MDCSASAPSRGSPVVADDDTRCGRHSPEITAVRGLIGKRAQAGFELRPAEGQKRGGRQGSAAQPRPQPRSSQPRQLRAGAAPPGESGSAPPASPTAAARARAPAAMAESDASGDSFSPRSSGSARGRLSLPSSSRNGSVSQRRRRRLAASLGRPPASEKGDEEDEEEDEDDGEEPESERPRPPGSSEGGGDERSRRMIRNQYRELICSVQREAGPGDVSREPGRQVLPPLCSVLGRLTWSAASGWAALSAGGTRSCWSAMQSRGTEVSRGVEPLPARTG